MDALIAAYRFSLNPAACAQMAVDAANGLIGQRSDHSFGMIQTEDTLVTNPRRYPAFSRGMSRSTKLTCRGESVVLPNRYVAEERE